MIKSDSQDLKDWFDKISLSSLDKDILRCLRAKPLSTQDVSDQLKISQEQALHSIRICRVYNLLETSRCGKVILNQITNEGITLFDQTIINI